MGCLEGRELARGLVIVIILDGKMLALELEPTVLIWPQVLIWPRSLGVPAHIT